MMGWMTCFGFYKNLKVKLCFKLKIIYLLITKAMQAYVQVRVCPDKKKKLYKTV